MRAHMTHGTWDFLEQIIRKKDADNFTLIYSETSSNALAYYETTSRSRSPFTAGRSYEVLLTSGSLEEEGYFVMNHVPLTTDGMPIFEVRFKSKQSHLDHVDGFMALRVLKPLKGGTYVIFTQWESAEAYEDWKETDHYTDFFDLDSIKQPAYFSARPFVTYYSFFHEDEDEDEDEESNHTANEPDERLIIENDDLKED